MRISTMIINANSVSRKQRAPSLNNDNVGRPQGNNRNQYLYSSTILVVLLVLMVKICQASSENANQTEFPQFGSRIRPIGEVRGSQIPDVKLLQQRTIGAHNEKIEPDFKHTNSELAIETSIPSKSIQSHKLFSDEPEVLPTLALKTDSIQEESSSKIVDLPTATAQKPQSLAELTAAATATGIIVGDLIGQYSELYNSNNNNEQLSSAPDSSLNEQPMNSQDGRIGDAIGGDNQARSESEDEAVLEERPNAILRGPIANNLEKQGYPLQSALEEPNDNYHSSSGVDLMPATFEGLMQANSEQTSESMQDPAEGSSTGELDNGNLAESDSGNREASPAELRSSSDNDGEGEAEDGISNPTIQQPVNVRNKHEERSATATIPHLNDGRKSIQSSSTYRAPLASDPLMVANPQTLLKSQPTSDSSQDLNTAAGHYYGKKKKKKVKKVLIKKKKKKKKKVVYKIKKIKIMKVKKKKKKNHYKKKVQHHDHGKYYMYAKVPKKKSWEFGFKKGNKKHWIERHEKGHKNKFKTKVRWYDKKSKGKGFHVWDYNHHDKKKKHYG